MGRLFTEESFGAMCDKANEVITKTLEISKKQAALNNDMRELTTLMKEWIRIFEGGEVVEDAKTSNDTQPLSVGKIPPEQVDALIKKSGFIAAEISKKMGYHYSVLSRWRLHDGCTAQQFECMKGAIKALKKETDNKTDSKVDSTILEKKERYDAIVKLVKDKGVTHDEVARQLGMPYNSYIGRLKGLTLEMFEKYKIAIYEVAKQKTIPVQDVAQSIFTTLPLKDGGVYEVTNAELSERQRAFPEIRVDLSFKNMHYWLINNPSRRKTRGGINKFISSWLIRDRENKK